MVALLGVPAVPFFSAENECQPSTGGDEASWLKRIAQIDVKQERLLELHLDGAIATERFRAKSAELRETRAAAERQLEAARSSLSRLEDMERGKDALISHYASLVPRGLAELSPDEKNRVYRMMRLRVFADRDGTLTADWGCNVLPTPPGSSTVTTNAFRFRAVLTGQDAELELSRV